MTWHFLVWYNFTDVSEEYTASILTANSKQYNQQEWSNKHSWVTYFSKTWRLGTERKLFPRSKIGSPESLSTDDVSEVT
jgi:hypothetical protein